MRTFFFANDLETNS